MRGNIHCAAELSGARNAADLAPISAALGLDDLLDAYPADLSGGQRQRAAAACALARRPRLILADETIASLDAENAAWVIDALCDLGARLGAALVFVTHQLDHLAGRGLEVLAATLGGVPGHRSARFAGLMRLPLPFHARLATLFQVLGLAALLLLPMLILFGIKNGVIADRAQALLEDPEALRITIGRTDSYPAAMIADLAADPDVRFVAPHPIQLAVISDFARAEPGAPVAVNAVLLATGAGDPYLPEGLARVDALLRSNDTQPDGGILSFTVTSIVAAGSWGADGRASRRSRSLPDPGLDARRRARHRSRRSAAGRRAPTIPRCASMPPMPRRRCG